MSDDSGTGAIDAEAVLAELRAPAVTARIAEDLRRQHPVRYQAAESPPGRIERINESSSVTVGTWRDGRFVADNA